MKHSKNHPAFGLLRKVLKREKVKEGEMMPKKTLIRIINQSYLTKANEMHEERNEKNMANVTQVSKGTTNAADKSDNYTSKGT